MTELNPTDTLAVLVEDNCDPVTVINLGSDISLSQVSEGDDFHNIILGLEQARELKDILERLLAN